ncbi:hypothetical protein [Halorubellus litoreus]|uniref:HEAT repeat n=1 Tax=Halorubellus litoreus TaxID=755308 RepID=A0ABD5VMX9_9EURY
MTYSSDPLDLSDRPACGDPPAGREELGSTDSSGGEADSGSTVDVDELAARLASDGLLSGSAVGFREVIQTCEACERVCDLATEAPAAARRLAPCVLAVVREAMDREGATVESLLLADVAERTLATALDAVGAVSDPKLATAYEAAGRPLESIVETLALVLRERRHDRYHDTVVEALGSVAMARPETVIEGLADAHALDDTVRALLDDCLASTPSEPKTATLSLAFAVIAHDPNAERVNRVRGRLDASAPTPAASVRMTGYVTYELAAKRTVAPRKDSDASEGHADGLSARMDSLEEFAAVVQDSVGTERERYARAVGEAAAVVGHGDVATAVRHANGGADAEEPAAELPLELVARVRASDDSERERAARALGEALAASLSPTVGVESLADRVAHTTGVEYVQSAQALGAIAVVAPGRIDASVPRRLVDRVERATGADRDHAMQVLGEAIATGYETTERSLTAALGRRVRDATSSTPRDRAARALWTVADSTGVPDGSRRGNPTSGEPLDSVDDEVGPLVAGTDADAAAVSAVSDALGNVPESERDAVCRALGIAIVDLAPDREVGPGTLAERVRNAGDESRRRAARVLGEALLGGASPETPAIYDALAARVRRAAGIDRDRTARSLAETAIAADAPKATATRGRTRQDSVALRERAAEASGSRRRRLTRALGEALARGDDSVNLVDVFEDLAAASTDLDRARSVRALGELVLSAPPTLLGTQTPPSWLVAHARRRTGTQRTSCVRAVGEAVLAERDDPSVDVVDALCGRVTSATDMEKIRSGKALAETLAAIDDHPNPPVSPSLVDGVTAPTDPSTRVSAAMIFADLRRRPERTAVLVRSIHANVGVERALIGRALGDRVALTDSIRTTAESSNGLAAALVDLVGRDDSRGPLAAEALGLAIAATTGDEGVPSRLESRLRDAVRSGGASDGRLAARALGTAAAVTDAVDDAFAIPTLAARVRSESEHERSLGAWGLGVAVAARDPTALAEDLLEGIEAPPNGHSGTAVARIVADAAEAGVLPARALVEALTVDSASTENTGRRTRLRDDAGGLDATLLEALATARDPGDATAVAAVRTDIRDALATSSDHPADTRVTAVDALASLPTTAVAQNEK